ncbi:hypothetical protein GOP47_0000377 [Adiantum capillus-veneris]|uniref:glutathione transferase n=1 Tax=Adiantum capillus-veneris TaxID=13818 RepID=A0A9D4VDF2_ADICA|nr:hypothetical protein GOP47_0000377 [Adiantum capillus-veneris]
MKKTGEQQPSTTEKIKLYSFCRSSCSWRVRIALAYKGIPYEYVAVDLASGEQFSEDFKKLNAFSTVPVLVDNDIVIADSFAILEYLEEKYPEPSLFPADIRKKALVRQVVNHIVASIQPLQNLTVLKRIEALGGPEERLKWAQHFIKSGFEALELLLTAEAGKYCFGEEFTMADIVLVPQLGNAERFQVDMTNFPLLTKIGEAVSALPYVKEASPQNQPDFVTF